MNTPSSSDPFKEKTRYESDSLNCVNVVIDLFPGEPGVRPMRPELLKLALEERARIARWQAEIEKRQGEGK